MAHPRKFRFGVQTASAHFASEWRDKARKAEELGYSTLFVPDHFGDPSSRRWSRSWPPRTPPRRCGSGRLAGT